MIPKLFSDHYLSTIETNIIKVRQAREVGRRQRKSSGCGQDPVLNS